LNRSNKFSFVFNFGFSSVLVYL